MDIGNETVETFIIKDRKYDVVGCWGSETPENEYEFYDLYDEDGNCLNEGDPWYERPTEQDVEQYLKLYKE